jgi:hypothetical protein
MVLIFHNSFWFLLRFHWSYTSYSKNYFIIIVCIFDERTVNRRKICHYYLVYIIYLYNIGLLGMTLLLTVLSSTIHFFFLLLILLLLMHLILLIFKAFLFFNICRLWIFLLLKTCLNLFESVCKNLRWGNHFSL